MVVSAALIVLGYAASACVLAWLYFGRHALARPPIGVFGLADVAFLLGGIVLVPLLYLTLPLWSVAGLLGLVALSALYLIGEPVLRARWACCVVVLALGGAEVGTHLQAGPASPTFFLVHNAIITLITVAIANLWAQSGMRARDAAILGAALTVYDDVATLWLPLMGDLFARMAELPFAPVVGWASGMEGASLGLGLGDLLLLAVFPLVLRKAYSRAAGLTALVIGLSALVGVVFLAGLLQIEVFPVMIVLGPLMVSQHLWWQRRRGCERTTWQYLLAESAWATRQ